MRSAVSRGKWGGAAKCGSVAPSADVRAPVWSVDPDQPIGLLRTLDDHVWESLSGPITIARFLTVSGVTVEDEACGRRFECVRFLTQSVWLGAARAVPAKEYEVGALGEEEIP